jgi:hypothetical protein
MAWKQPEFSPAERKCYSRRQELLFLPPTPEELGLIPKVLEMFEGREAIYQEQGFLRVRVLNLRHKVGKREIEFDVEEVRTPGLGVGRFKSASKQFVEKLIRWDGFVFFDNMTTLHWGSEQSGANFNFDPDVIAAILNCSVALPEEMDDHAAYNDLSRIINQMIFEKMRSTNSAFGEPVFPMDELLKEYLSALR